MRKLIQQLSFHIHVLQWPFAGIGGALIDFIHYVHPLHYAPKGGIFSVQMIRPRSLANDKKLVGRGKLVRIINFATGHRKRSSVVAKPFFGVGRKQILPILTAFLHGVPSVGIPALNNEIFHHSVKTRIVKISILHQKNKIGAVVWGFFKQFNVETPEIGGDAHAFFGVILGVFIKKRNGTLGGKGQILFRF